MQMSWSFQKRAELKELKLRHTNKHSIRFKTQSSDCTVHNKSLFMNYIDVEIGVIKITTAGLMVT